MALILPLGFVQVIHSLRMLNDPEPMIVTYGGELDTADNPPGVTAANLGSKFAVNVMPALSNQLNLFMTTVRFGTVANVAGAVGVADEDTTGGIVGNIVPQNTAFLVKKFTAMAGKRNQGHLYIPGVQEEAVTNTGVLPPSDVRTGLQAGLTAWLASIQAGPDLNNMVVLHSTGISPAPPPTVVTSLILDVVVATQRRRLRK